jgi:ATP-dependent DNA ligase
VHVDLPVMPPILPMLAKPVKGVPSDGGYAFEPKWDDIRSSCT